MAIPLHLCIKNVEGYRIGVVGPKMKLGREGDVTRVSGR